MTCYIFRVIAAGMIDEIYIQNEEWVSAIFASSKRNWMGDLFIGGHADCPWKGRSCRGPIVSPGRIKRRWESSQMLLLCVSISSSICRARIVLSGGRYNCLRTDLFVFIHQDEAFHQLLIDSKVPFICDTSH